MKQEKENKYFEADEEQGVSFFEFMSVIFGRKLLLLIVSVATFVASSVGVIFYHNSVSTYQAEFNYSSKGLAQGKYYDGSYFDIRDLVTVDKLNQYKAEHEELNKLDMKKIYRDGIKSLTHDVKYVENVNINTQDNTVERLIDEDSFKIVINKKYLSRTQAQVLVEAIANEAVVISRQISETADYGQYLKFYTATNAFDKKIEYIGAQLKLIDDKYDNLLKEYGDAIVSSGDRISDSKLRLDNYFGEEAIGVSELQSELNANGFVKNDPTYKSELENKKEALQREKAVCEQNITAFNNQIDTLLTGASGGQINTVELEKYNEAIIELITKSNELNEKINVLTAKIANFGRTDAEYVTKLADFEKKVEDAYNFLAAETTTYSNIEKEVVKKDTVVYFAKYNIVEQKSPISLIVLLVIAAVGSFVVGLLVNLIIDGKKLTLKYKREHQQELEQVKEIPQQKE